MSSTLAVSHRDDDPVRCALLHDVNLRNRRIRRHHRDIRACEICDPGSDDRWLDPYRGGRSRLIGAARRREGRTSSNQTSVPGSRMRARLAQAVVAALVAVLVGACGGQVRASSPQTAPGPACPSSGTPPSGGCWQAVLPPGNGGYPADPGSENTPLWEPGRFPLTLTRTSRTAATSG